MKLDRLTHDPAALVDFFEQGLASMGSLSERTWHDRLQLVAEGRAARLWNDDGEFVEKELHFVPAEAGGSREADCEVFPGCPLTFRLFEAICSGSLGLERAVLEAEPDHRPPSLQASEKIWRAQFPGTTRWRLESALKPAWHFIMLALVRCEIQAIDQHWSLHRVAFNLIDGRRDESFANQFDFVRIDSQSAATIRWPRVELDFVNTHLRTALEAELAGDLASIRERQERFLRREINRIDDYFERYECELRQRMERARAENSKARFEERITAARTEHERRRQDQAHRHVIRVLPHLDALLLLAEPAWEAVISWELDHADRASSAVFVPRAREWFKLD